jgi:hypothetical protein
MPRRIQNGGISMLDAAPNVEIGGPATRQFLFHSVYGYAGGNFAGPVAAHAVSHSAAVLSDEAGIFIALPDQTYVCSAHTLHGAHSIHDRF